MFNPTSTVTQDQGPSWSILEAARDIGQLPGITGREDSWVPGINLWWMTGGVDRWPHRRQFNPPTVSYDDPLIASIGDPSVWPDPVLVEQGGVTVYDMPDGLKAIDPDPSKTPFRSFSVYAPLVEQDLMADSEESIARAAARFRAQVSGQVAAEFADSLFTKNEGLYRTAADISGADPVNPILAFSALSEAYGTAVTEDNAANGDAMITVPWHAIPQLTKRRLIQWDGGRLVDCFGNTVNSTPGQILDGPITDPDDLETSVAPTAGNGWFYISPRPYVGLGGVRRAPTGQERVGRGPSGTQAYANQQVGLAEAPAIVVFRPTLTFAINTSLNEVVGTTP